MPKKKSNNPDGRPNKYSNDDYTNFAPEYLEKLEEAFMYGMTNKQACLMANITEASFYDICDKNPQILKRLKLLREHPKMAARKNIVDAVQKGDLDTSKWFAERKMKGEFSQRQEHTGADGGALNIKLVNYGDNNNSVQLPTKNVPAASDEANG